MILIIYSALHDSATQFRYLPHHERMNDNESIERFISEFENAY